MSNRDAVKDPKKVGERKAKLDGMKTSSIEKVFKSSCPFQPKTTREEMIKKIIWAEFGDLSLRYERGE